MKYIENPVLRGFNPDPCILRVGDDYYIATSTFEWWPGVQIHHSRDMRHWRLLTRPLNRLSQLDLHGVPNSGGIWAPDLSHDGEQFYLVYTNVRHWQNRNCFFDSPNFLVTAKEIKAGHASFVETQWNSWYLAHLCGRPLEKPVSSSRHCNLGRVTAIQRRVWGDDGWPRLAHERNTPKISVPGPDLPDHVFELESGRDNFDRTELSFHFQSRRTPLDPNWISLTARPGFLRLYGRESLNSRHYQSLIGRRRRRGRAFRAGRGFCPGRRTLLWSGGHREIFCRPVQGMAF
jgi:beta-xylosidase